METTTVSFLEDKVDFLKEVDILSDIDNDVLERIASILTEKRFSRQEAIVKKGQAGDSMYIITRGEVRVHDRGHVLCRLGPGEVFGEYSLFDEEVRSASVTAEKVTYVLELRGDSFARICDNCPEVPRGVLMRLIKKMRERNVLEEKLAKSYIRIQKQKTEIEEQNKNIQRQKKLLEQQNYDLLSLNEEKNKLIKMVMHGIKNPITSGKCITEMVLEDPTLSDTHKESLEVVLNSIDRINQMISQVLNVNLIESKVYQPKMEMINISAIAEEIWRDYQYIFDQKNLENDLTIEHASACLNKVYLCQIIDHLLAYSTDRLDSNDRINLNIFKKDDKVVLQLADNGRKLEEKEIEKIFSQYKRQQRKMKDAGSIDGLSLAIVHKYTNSMNGLIQIKSDNEQTVFEVSFLAECK